LMVVKKHWLEVADKKHRYGKNLKLYYEEWKLRGRPLKSFWVWLDCPNYEINGHSPNFVDLPTCPRTKLDRETVHYVTEKAERDSYAVVIGDDGIFRSRRPQALLPDLGPGATVAALACTSIAAPSTLQPIVTGEQGWIFVLREDTLYAGPKVTETAPRFHHTSFLGGEACAAAGTFFTSSATPGQLVQINPHSGHYRPYTLELHRLLMFLTRKNVSFERTDDLETFALPLQVDMQRVMKVTKQKKKKAAAPHLWPAQTTLNFLQHKLQHGRQLERQIQRWAKQQHLMFDNDHRVSKESSDKNDPPHSDVSSVSLKIRPAREKCGSRQTPSRVIPSPATPKLKLYLWGYPNTRYAQYTRTWALFLVVVFVVAIIWPVAGYVHPTCPALL
jgi:hypothetical protein